MKNFCLHSNERGVTLIIVLVLLVVVTVLGIGGARIALLGERSTRYDRDSQVAWQSAEAALVDAEYDIAGPNSNASGRVNSFTPENVGIFAPGCGQTAPNRGLCESSSSAIPIWASVDFLNTGGSAPTVAFGEMTGRAFLSGANGVQPAHRPRYIIEYVCDTRPGRKATSSSTTAPCPVLYRITSIGFGPNEQVQVMMQSSFARGKKV